MKLISWNVNGIRAVAKKGLFDWLAQEKPDLLCLQETKAHPEQLDEEILKPQGYQTFWSSAKRKGYSGTALFIRTESKIKPLTVREGLEIPEFDVEGRTLIAEYPEFILYNSYYPNGGHELLRVPYKLSYSDAVLDHALKTKKSLQKPIILTGDFNTAHQSIDLARPKQNEGNTGFLPEERAWLDKLISKGFVDIFREFETEAGHYTWWSYRAGARQKNIGWRIDYFFVTPELKDHIKKSYHQPHILGSDHCPVVLELK